MKWLLFICCLCIVLCSGECIAKPKDVIRIMTYNVMKYGEGCEMPNEKLHEYFKTITAYTNPDILGLEKVAAIPQRRGRKGKAPFGFADSILKILNSSMAGKYAYCPFTNTAGDNDQNILFYNKHKLGFASSLTLVSDVSDFNMYKLFYLDTGEAKKHDTTFLYIILNHTESGDKPQKRNKQMEEIMNALKKNFKDLDLVNIITMGDFNLRNSSEKGYQSLINGTDKRFQFFDPPFVVDNKLAYPADWESHPKKFASFLTTSTRLSKKKPIDCGTDGGAKGWYDHILISHSLTQKSNYIHYLPNSYNTIGNDGKRINASVAEQPNKSVPAAVAEALFQFSNKYPVMLELIVDPGTDAD